MSQYTINSPARIHLGFLDLSFKNVRNFGSLGMAISNFGTIIQAKSSKKFKLVGEKPKKLDNVFKIEKIIELNSLSLIKLKKSY